MYYNFSIIFMNFYQQIMVFLFNHKLIYHQKRVFYGKKKFSQKNYL